MRICIILLMFFAISISYACDSLIDIGEVGIITKGILEKKIKIKNVNLFKKIGVYKHPFGAFVVKNKKMIVLNNMIDSCKLIHINKLLSEEKLHIVSIEQLDVYVKELFGLSKRDILIDPTKTDVIYPTNKNLQDEFLANGILYSDYCNYYLKRNVNKKVYVVNHIYQNDEEYFEKPEVSLIFFLIELYNGTFKIMKINADEAYGKIYQ